VTHPPADFAMQRSSRDAANVPKRLAEWLATHLPEGAEPTVTLHTGIAANGMSSETLILDAAWTERGGHVAQPSRCTMRECRLTGRD
jgi:aminoglycoside phosphotransferase (APT) family kinase protein